MGSDTRVGHPKIFTLNGFKQLRKGKIDIKCLTVM